MNAVLQAIAENRRREILSLIRAAELTSGEIAARFPEVTGPAISQHLKVLSEAGLVTIRRQGTRRYYRVRPAGLTELRLFLDTFEKSVEPNTQARPEAEAIPAPPPAWPPAATSWKSARARG